MSRQKRIKELIREPSFFKLLNIVKEYRLLVTAVIITQLINTLITLWFANTTMNLFNLAPNFNEGELLGILGTFIIVIGLRFIISFLYRWLHENLNESVLFGLRFKVLTHLQNLSLSFHESTHSSVSDNIYHHELQITRNFIVFDFINLISLPYSLIVIAIYLVTVHPVLGIIALVIGPLQLYFSLYKREKYKEVVEIKTNASRDVLFHVSETLTGIRELKENQLEERFTKKFKQLCDKGIKAWSNFYRLHFLRDVIKDIPYHFGYLLGIAAGSYLMLNGKINTGGLVAYITLLDKVSAPFNVLAGAISNLHQSIAGAQKLFEVLDMETEEYEKGITLLAQPPSIDFHNVSFAYMGKHPTIQNVSFSVENGSSVAIVGPSGAGKSTLIKLLYRYYDYEKGSIFINGTDVSRYAIKSLRRNMAVVSQDIHMFDGSIKENIAVSNPEASDHEIEDAAKMAQAYDFISLLPKGFDTEVGERGVKLSQGQKQRIAIARAILKKANLLILDEPTSALDVETEAELQKSINIWSKDCTKIIIAHRLSTIREVDYVVFMENGTVIEKGTPQELFEMRGRFYKYWVKQSMEITK
ncbi:ABC transporter ATP-binding protein [Cytobacillus oceanisediminis]|uniref:ABC transporter ATP-binding protein n=1 Tax=Cytobacillus oceanisediminis TaxID=665099 RepID=UPI001C215EC9|nr:ABC transporter ATP-binding protein [Cytobacillus oceanisediminis]MBU8772093.1 ABC transporter ATP-binding protein/permease [Cytobacillus oceanisediminis]